VKRRAVATRSTSPAGARFVLLGFAAASALTVAIYLFAVAAGWEALDWAPERSSAAAAGAAVVVLALDALVPVPASLVMVAVGAAFTLPLALAIAFAGREAMSLVCYVVGRFGGGAAERLVDPEARLAAKQMLDRHGAYALLLSRPVPVVAESALFVAGLSRMAARRALAAATVASAAEAGAYVLLGRLAGGAWAAGVLWLTLVALAGATALARSRRREARPRLH
jgi:membrane protein DedA with SNARE-associated domain